MTHPEFCRYAFDLPEIAEAWRRGSVIRSWLLDLTAAALYASPDLADFAGQVADSGEGRWTAMAAIDEEVPAPVLTAALYSRFASREAASLAGHLGLANLCWLYDNNHITIEGSTALAFSEGDPDRHRLGGRALRGRLRATRH